MRRQSKVRVRKQTKVRVRKQTKVRVRKQSEVRVRKQSDLRLFGLVPMEDCGQSQDIAQYTPYTC